jgi:hypothetical protein
VAQRPGLGFPLARIATVFSLAFGVVLDLGICRYAGKGQSETWFAVERLSPSAHERIPGQARGLPRPGDQPTLLLEMPGTVAMSTNPAVMILFDAITRATSPRSIRPCSTSLRRYPALTFFGITPRSAQPPNSAELGCCAELALATR